MTPHAPGTAHIAVVGAGGNIGSHLVMLLARMPWVGRLTLVDPDTYAPHNVHNQAISPRAVGQPKARVQARQAREVNPALRIDAHHAAVEDLPLGALRADLVLSCPDSRRARQCVNLMAWRLGVPWLDAGVMADELLARLDLFVPAEDAPCLECRWGPADYAALEQRHACAVETSTAPGAPAALGALAASLQALACAQWLDAPSAATALVPGGQLVLSARAPRLLATRHDRNPDCRVRDHAPWHIEPLPATSGTTLGGLLRRVGATEPGAQLRVFGQDVVRATACANCGRPTPSLVFRPASAPDDGACPACGARAFRMEAGGAETLMVDDLPAALRRSSLRAIGLRDGDVVTVEGVGPARHFELRLTRRGVRRPQPRPRQEVS